MARRQFQDLFPDVLVNRQNINLASVGANAVASTNVTIPGVQAGDLVLVATDGALLHVTLKAAATAADTVVLSYGNPTAAPIDPAATNFTFVVLKVRVP